MVKLYCEPFQETLKRIADSSVQMVFIDPPYGIQAAAPLRRPEGGLYNGMANVAWDNAESLESWQETAPVLLSELRRILTPNGTGFMCGTYHNIFEMGCLLSSMGFWVLNKIIWQKTNPAPNFAGSRLCASYEEIIWFKRDKRSPYLFNYQQMKMYNEGKQLKDIWTIGSPAGRERIKNPLTGGNAHPSQKPLKLLERIIDMSTNPGDLVFDPFAGTATTLVQAGLMGRSAIGAEMDTSYAYMAQERINVHARIHTAVS